MKTGRICAVAAIVAVLGGPMAGCAWVEEETGFGTSAQIGAASGATAGGLLAWGIGGGPVGIAAGVILGAVTGGALGDVLGDDAAPAASGQQESMQGAPEATTPPMAEPAPPEPESAAPMASSEEAPTMTPESKPDTPAGTFVTKDGRTCRHYEQRVIIDGQEQTVTGTACKTADGSWQVQSS